MVVTQIRLQNFKTHKDTTVTFDKVTSIVGLNGNGKTNLVKGLLLVLYNEDWPVEFIKNGETESTITIWLSNGNKVERSRTKSKQKIIITYADGSTLDLTGKKDAQSYIELATGVSKIKLKSGEIINLNYQEVRNKTSLLEGSSATLAKRFGYLLKTEKAEIIKSDTSKSYKDLFSTWQKESTELENLDLDILTLKNKLVTVEKLNENITNLESQVQVITQSIEFLKENKDYFQHNNLTFRDLKKFQDFISFYKDFQKKVEANPFNTFKFKAYPTELKDSWVLDLDPSVFNTVCPTCGK